MEGVTTALVAFMFFCVIFPERVKNRPQFYAAFGMICLIILLSALGQIITATGFRMFSLFGLAMLQVGTILMLFMCVGGLSWDELKGELGNTIEVIRRGGEEKEIIVPLTGQKPPPKDEAEPGDRGNVIRLTPPGSPGGSQKSDGPDEPRIPLE